MRLKFLSDVNKGISIEDSYDNQRVVGILIDDGDIIVMFVDKITDSYYIEQVINKFAVKMFESSNFKVINDDERWKTYEKFFLDSGVTKFAGGKSSFGPPSN